jgi:ferredoxin
MMFPKTKYLRDKKRIEACRSLPCQHCGAEDGTVVAAHSNEGIHGKGRGIKASDEFVAALCFTCHANLDQGRMSKQERAKMWQKAHEQTILLLANKNDIVPL